MRWSSSALDATIDQLNRLHEATRERTRRDRETLQTHLDRLDVVTTTTSDEPLLDDGRSASRTRPEPAAPAPSAVVQQARGWPNEVVRQKIVDEAIRGGRWSAT